MMNERALFDAALEFNDPVKRRAFVEKACAGDQELLRKVTSLLDAHDQANSFLENPALNLQPTDLEKTAQSSNIDKTSDFAIGQSNEAFAKIETRNSESDDSDEEKVDLSFLKPPTKPGSIGSLGHYEILHVLGQGGFGVVFKAFDEKLHRLVAIKVMNPQMAATSPPRKRFLREARAVAAIKNENVVQVYSVEEQPLPYMVMEFIDGQTLQQKLDGNGPLEVNEVLYLGRQMAGALAAAHALGIIHRDIKPGNILLEQGVEQKVKITDFGLARAADDASMTRTGLISGTPMYMSPEQALGQQLDPRSDLFSLGSVLYQMACGRAPFRAPTAIAVLRRVADETPRPVQQILPEIPDWLAALIEKLHAKKPEERFQSAKELSDLLARYQSEIQQHGLVKSFTKETSSRPTMEPTTETTTPQSNLASQKTSSQPANKKSNKVLPGAAVALISLVALLPFFIPRKKSNDTDPNQISQTQTNGVGNSTTTGWYGWPADAPPPAVAPFNADQAKQHQEAWAKYLNVPVEYTNSIGMKFRLIPPGEFMMGSTEKEIEVALPYAREDKLWQDCIKSEGPQHQVVLTRAIYMSVHEVTQGQYQQITAGNPSYFSATGEWSTEVTGIETTNFPVEGVSWKKANDFCERLREKEKLNSLGNGIVDGAYRLPSEAEWEYACRAGTLTQFNTGDVASELSQAGWYINSSAKRTHSVGEKQSNNFGLYDVHGNVWEWVVDAWNPEWYATQSVRPAVNPLNSPGTDSERMARGGNYSSGSYACRSASRCSEASSYNATLIGFRIALSVDAVRALLKLTGPAIPKLQAMELSSTATATEKSDSKFPMPNVSNSTPSGETKSEALSERELAEWLLTKPGMKLGLYYVKGGAVDVKFSELLPTNAYFINSIDWFEAALITDFDLARIGQAKRLGSLYLGDPSGKLLHVTDKGVESLMSPAVAKSLMRFILLAQLPNVTNEGYLKFNRAANLREFSLYHYFPPADGKFLNELQLPELRNLGIFQSDIQGGWLSKIVERSPDIEQLQVQGVRLAQEDINALSRLDSLKVLHLSPPGIDFSLTDAEMQTIGSLPQLNALNLTDNCQLTDVGISAIANRKLLNDLRLTNAKLTDSACETIATLQELERLALGGTRITDSGVEKLKSLPKLKFLFLMNLKRLTDAGLDSLAQMSELKDLDIRGNPQLTEPAIRKLQAAMPNCKIVSDYPDVAPMLETNGKQVVDYATERKAAEWLLAINSNAAVSTFAVRDQSGIERSIGTAEELPEGPFHVSIVSLQHLGELITDESLGNLRGLTGLERLDLTFCKKVTDAGIAHLSGCFSLKSLVMPFVPVTDKCVDSFSRMSNLERLDVQETSILDEGFHRLVLDHPKLTFVGLPPELSSASLADLQKLKSLSWLAMRAQYLTSANLPHFQQLTGVKDWIIAAPDDDQVRVLADLPQVESLLLHVSTVKPSAVVDLAKMPKLIRFTLEPVSNDHVKAIVRLTRLAGLKLRGQELNDAGLKYLREMTSLKELDITKTGVSKSGVQELQTALPNCKIVSDQLDTDE